MYRYHFIRTAGRRKSFRSTRDFNRIPNIISSVSSKRKHFVCVLSAFISTMAGAEPNLNILTIPEEKARLAPFPPSCRVLAHFPDTATPIVSGTIGRIFVDLFSSSRENQYVVIPDDNPNASNVATESHLCYGPGCPVYLKSSTASILSSVPGMNDLISSSAGGNKLEAAVMSAYRTTFQAGADSSGASSRSRWMYSLEVTTRDEKIVIRHGISRDLVSYRRVDEKQEKKKAVGFSTRTKKDCASVSNSASASASNSASPSKLLSINAQSSFSKDDDECSSITMSVAGRPSLKRALSADASLSLSSDAQFRAAKRMKSGETSDDSFSTTTDTVHVRRIDIPKYVAYEYLKMKLIGSRGGKCRSLESKLGIKYSLIHRQLKASHQFLDRTDRYGDIAPIRGSPNCIMIRAKTRETVQHAIKVIVHILSNEFRGKNGTSGETLKQELLESVQEATIQDPSFDKTISSLNADDTVSLPRSHPSVSDEDDDSSSSNVIDPNYTFSTDDFSDNEEVSWGRSQPYRKKFNHTNRRNIRSTSNHSKRSGGRSVRRSGGNLKSRSAHEPTWRGSLVKRSRRTACDEPTTRSRSPVKRSRPNIVTPAKRPAPTIDSALSSKR